MSYRFLRLSTTYPAAIRAFDAQTDISDLTYAEAYSRYVGAAFAEADVFSYYLNTLGREAQDIFVNVHGLQDAWAREHGRTYDPGRWLELVSDQIADIRPDVLYLDDLYLFDRRVRHHLRVVLPPRSLIVGWQAAPTLDYAELDDLDAFFSAGKNFVDGMSAVGVRSYLLPLAFDERVLEAVPETEPDLLLTFVGSVGNRRNLAFRERRRFIEAMLARTQLEVWDATLPDPGTRIDRLIWAANWALGRVGLSAARRRIPLVRRGWWWKEWIAEAPLNDLFPGRIHQPRFGLGYLEILRRSKITLNFHTTAAEGFGGNLRMYEATGMGACLVTDHKDNLSDLFELDTEIVVFRNTDECIEKVGRLLADDELRTTIAAAGRKRTLKDHTWRRRIEEFDRHLLRLLADLGAR